MPSAPPSHRPNRAPRPFNGRKGATARGYSSKWEAARKRFLAENPLCRDCESTGTVTAAEVVDHIVPHRGDTELFWDANNWQSLCKRHHDQKTARGE